MDIKIINAQIENLEIIKEKIAYIEMNLLDNLVKQRDDAIGHGFVGAIFKNCQNYIEVNNQLELWKNAKKEWLKNNKKD